MIINSKEKHDISGDDFVTIKSKVNKNKLAKLYNLLSNIYRNPIGAIVREYASNAYDANKEAYNFATLSYEELQEKYSWIKDPKFNMDKEAFLNLKSKLKRVDKEEPIVTGIIEKDNQFYFYVKDYGIGLSPERIEHIYFNYLDSTKEDNNDEIGGFGIGSKSALSYTHTFYIDVNYNGITYKYIMTKDVGGIPQGQLLYQSEYDDTLENGTIIKVKLKDPSEIPTFTNEISKQLSYMHNLYVDDTVILANLHRFSYESRVRNRVKSINDFKIYKINNWSIRSNNVPVDEMHLCLGNVTYTIDWTELGIPHNKCQIALRFETGELEPTPSRESIVYDKHSIALIKARIEEVVDYYKEEYFKDKVDTNDLYEFCNNRNRYNPVISYLGYDIDMSLLISNFKDVHDKNQTTYKPFKDFKYIPYTLFEDYEVMKSLSSNTAKVTYNKRCIKPRNFPLNLSHHYKFVMDRGVNKQFNFHQTAYLFEKIIPTCNTIQVLKKIDEFDYESYLSKYHYTGDEFEKIVKIYKEETSKYLEKKALAYDNHVPDPNWFHNYNAGLSKYSVKKRKQLEGKVNAMVTYNRNYFSRDTFKLESLRSSKGIVCYAATDEKELLGKLIHLLSCTKSFRDEHDNLKHKSIMGLVVSKSNYKIMQNMENTIEVKDLILEVKTFRRIATAEKIKKGLNTLVQSLEHVLKVNDDLALKFKSIETYIRNHDRTRFHDGGSISNEFMKDMLKIADIHDYYDKDMLADFDFLVDYADGMELLQYLEPKLLGDELPECIIEYVKSKGKRVANRYFLKA